MRPARHRSRSARQSTVTLLFAVGLLLVVALGAHAAVGAAVPGPAGTAVPSGVELCPRPTPGGTVPEPHELRSRDGVLTLELFMRNDREKDGSTRYCYLLADGTQSPTLRLHPGDLLVLRLRNGLVGANGAAGSAPARNAHEAPAPRADVCNSGEMSDTATNLHFHGLSVPPVCHQDEVLRTSLPSGAVFEYRFRIPANEPPGLYWYHPHIHGFTTRQVLGGASGALIIEGLERAVPEVAGLPERVLVIRDQDLLHPDAPPSKSEPVIPQILLDADGDSANNHTGYGKPAKDLSVNFVPVPYPDYPPARIGMRPGERQLWRVLNASAVTYLHLAVLFNQVAQQLGVVAIDGVPINISGGSARSVAWADHIGVPPGGRVEFIVSAPPQGVSALLMTRSVDTGNGGENDPNRSLVAIVAAADAPAPASTLPLHREPLPPPALPWLGNVSPVRVRKLYFSETQIDPKDPKSPVVYFITEQGKTPKPFDPSSTEPDIVVRQGDVEDWIIENRSQEVHAFHIHQLHFLLLDWFGLRVEEPFLRDTVNVPYYDPKMGAFPSVRLRMDFRDPDTVGTFVYHCHLLEHEDGGMMGRIRVEPGAPASAAAPTRP
jgi:FtsP/CotA-like multicopper oxidase with cupredoxin domain